MPPELVSSHSASCGYCEDRRRYAKSMPFYCLGVNVVAAKGHLWALAEVLTRTHNTLAQAAHHPAQHPRPGGRGCLSETLEHAGHVREGFVLCQGTSPQTRISELWRLVTRVLASGLDRIEEMGHVLYRTSYAPLGELAFNAVGRTYAFFEASVWLINRRCLFIVTDRSKSGRH